jgi:TolB-like protein/Flp pilus assembly protein TadD
MSSMLHLLGRPVAVVAGKPMPGLPEKAFIILAFLRFERSSAGRTKVASLLWESAAPADAARNLRQVLNNIRVWERKAGQKVLNIGRADLWLDETCIPCDLDAISELARLSDEDQLRDLQDLCGGELLEGVSGGIEFQAWLDGTRSRVERRIGSLLTAASSRISRGAVVSAVAEICQRLPNSEVLAAVYGELETKVPARAVLRPNPNDSIVLGGTDSRLPGQSALPRLTIVMPKEVLLMPPRGVLLTSSLIDHITIELGRSRRLAVIAPHTAWQLAATDFVSAANEHAIPFVLELRLLPGSGAETQHHSAKLINTNTREILWSDDFSIETDSLQQRLRYVAKFASAQLVDRIENTLLREHVDTGDGSAYIWELMGRRHMHSLDLRRIRRARNYFRSAIDADTYFAPAWYGAARTLTREWVLCAREDPKLLADARAYAQRAMELDPLDSGGERELGHAALYCGDLPESIAHFSSAEQLTPHNADVLVDLADAHVHNSEIETAAALIEKALDLNPLAPDEYHWVAASVDFFREDFSLARQKLKRMKETAPAARLLAAAAAMDGDMAEAGRYRAIEMANHPDFTIGSWLKLMPRRGSEQTDLYIRALRTAGFAQ